MSGEDDRHEISTYQTYVSSPGEKTVLLVKQRGETWRDKIGLYDVTELNFWRLVLAEFVYTLLLTLIACGCTLNIGSPRSELHQAICVGTIIFILASVSSEGFGYFNPAISFGLLVARKISIVRFFVYAAVQVAGSCAGAGLLYLYTPESVRGHLGTLSLHSDLTPGLGFVIELTLMFIIVMAVIVTSDPTKDLSRLPSPLVVGLSFTAVILMGMPYTGAGVNPARAFGPAAITGNLVHEHWIYWVGPLVGAAIASLTYEFIFKLAKKPTPVEPKNEMPRVQLHIKSSNSSV